MEEFEKLVKPIITYLIENYDPHVAVVITDNGAKIIRDELGIIVKETNSEELVFDSFKRIN